MTKQEIFNQAYLGLKAQGFRQSMLPISGDDMQCAYRGEDGRKCALGHCISDENYTSEMEGSGGSELQHDYDLFPDINDTWLDALQAVHDTHPVPSQMERELCIFAMNHGLTVPA